MTESKHMIVKMIKEDKELFKSYLAEVLTGLFQGEIRTNLVSLRNLVNATCGFPALSTATGIHEKSLHRILSATGNPKTVNLFAIVNTVLDHQGLEMKPIDIEQKVA